jgi:hypothetical protein
MAIFVSAWYYCEFEKDSDEHIYNLIYSMIQNDIKRAKMTAEDYQNINDKIEVLSKLPYKNPEKTIALDMEFRIKFEEFIDEFSVESIFAGE